MKKTVLLVLSSLLILWLVGCASSTPSSIVKPLDFEGREPPADVNWISPGRVKVGNFHAGARAEYPLTIHNGNDTVTKFSIAARIPDNVPENREKVTEDIIQDWVIIADPTPILRPKETREVLIALVMPKNAVTELVSWELWIGVKDATQTGMVRTELVSSWLVDMR